MVGRFDVIETCCTCVTVGKVDSNTNVVNALAMAVVDAIMVVVSRDAVARVDVP